MHFSFALVVFVLGVFTIPGLQSAVRWPCNTDADCASVDRATCSSIRLCRCPAGFTFAANVTACIPESLYGESCSENSQCSHMLTGSKCNGVCECADGFTYIRGRCKQLVGLHENCSDDIDCYFGFDRESVSCVEQKCQCADGFYQRTENICRRKSMNAGDACVVHQDCVGSGPDTQQCVDDVCVWRNVGVQTSFQAAEEPKKPVERKNAATSFDRPATLSKAVSVHLEKTPKVVIADDVKFGAACTTPNAPCPGLAHSMCQLEQCQCQPGYFHEHGVCKAEIGEVAETAELCSGAGRDEVTNKCICPRNYFAHSNLRQCLRPGFGIDASCAHQSQCSAYGAAVCPGIEVLPQYCRCRPYADHDTKNQMCVPKTELGSLCASNQECENRVTNSDCQDQLCVCKKHYISQNGRCEAGIGAACAVDVDCVPANAQCSHESGTCQCRAGFVQAGEQCLKEAAEFEEDCNENEQCKPLLGPSGKCIDSKCRCEDHQQHTNGQCNEKRVLGESCSKSSECFVTVEPENTVCRNGVCSCQFGTNKDMAKLTCRKSSSNRPSVMKVITLLLTAAAVTITGAAIHDAYS